MKLTAHEEYGLRCLVQVARHAPDPRHAPCRIERIAEAEGLSYEHCAKVLRRLRLAELVVSTRGAAGGYHLARPAAEITVRDVLHALDGPLYDASFCQSFAGQQPSCVHSGACAVRGVWQLVGDVVDRALAGVTLAQLVVGGAPSAAPRQSGSQSATSAGQPAPGATHE